MASTSTNYIQQFIDLLLSITSFLKEVETSAALTPNDVRKSYLPIISIVPIVSECPSINFLLSI